MLHVYIKQLTVRVILKLVVPPCGLTYEMIYYVQIHCIHDCCLYSTVPMVTIMSFCSLNIFTTH